jgi:hypothetical protein
MSSTTGTWLIRALVALILPFLLYVLAHLLITPG